MNINKRIEKLKELLGNMTDNEKYDFYKKDLDKLIKYIDYKEKKKEVNDNNKKRSRIKNKIAKKSRIKNRGK